MVKITPITTWTQAGQNTLDTIIVSIVSDNLSDSMTKLYQIGITEDINGTESFSQSVPPVTGNVQISGEDYENLDNTDINTAIYDYVISQLGLEKA